MHLERSQFSLRRLKLFSLLPSMFLSWMRVGNLFPGGCSWALLAAQAHWVRPFIWALRVARLVLRMIAQPEDCMAWGQVIPTEQPFRPVNFSFHPCKCQDGERDATTVPLEGRWPLQSMCSHRPCPEGWVLGRCLWGTASVTLKWMQKLRRQEQLWWSGLSAPACPGALLPAWP